MEKFLHGCGQRSRIELEEFWPTQAQLFLYERRNESDIAITRDLHDQVRQVCAKNVHTVPASARMLFVPDTLTIVRMFPHNCRCVDQVALVSRLLTPSQPTRQYHVFFTYFLRALRRVNFRVAQRVTNCVCVVLRRWEAICR